MKLAEIEDGYYLFIRNEISYVCRKYIYAEEHYLSVVMNNAIRPMMDHDMQTGDWLVRLSLIASSDQKDYYPMGEA